MQDGTPKALLYEGFARVGRALGSPARIELLHRRMREGGVLVLDVRSAAGHVAGAVSIPLGELPARLAGLPRDEEIIAYCRGRFCALTRRSERSATLPRTRWRGC
jgi:hypothetical protein